MKKILGMLFLLLMLGSMTARSPSKEFTPDYTSAIGAIFVNSKQELPENTKVYARFENNQYHFDLDAACVYFFDAAEDVAYAGEQNFTRLTFAGDIDGDTVGTEGAVAYQVEAASENTVLAYYLYNDETGMYFNTSVSFETAEISDMCVVKGKDYPCAVTFEVKEPADALSVTCFDDANNVVSEINHSLGDIMDMQRFEMDTNIHSAEITRYSSEGIKLDTITVTADISSVVVCYDNGGQILGNKELRFIWQQ